MSETVDGQSSGYTVLPQELTSRADGSSTLSRLLTAATEGEASPVFAAPGGDQLSAAVTSALRRRFDARCAAIADIAEMCLTDAAHIRLSRDSYLDVEQTVVDAARRLRDELQ